MLRGERLNKSGFTFIEALLVVIIIGILGAAILPSFFPSSIGSSLAADVVASDIAYTQIKAMKKNMPLTFTVTGSFTYGYGDGLSRDLRTFNPFLSISAVLPITFNGLGEPLGLAAPAVITVNDGIDTRSVVIEPYTGKLTLQ